MKSTFPGPNLNRLIETDPMIVKVNLDQVEWGSRRSVQNMLGGNPATPGHVAGPPAAPEMRINHTGGTMGPGGRRNNSGQY